MWFKGDQVVFDTDKENAPIKFCRLAPQEINNRYWQQCEKSSISSNAAGMRHAADLIWKHLDELKKAHSIEDLIFVVPSHYRSSNLQLLLGIAQSLSINVKAVFNGAVLSVVDELNRKETVSDGQYMHLDVQLHQTVVSTVSVNNGAAKLGDIEIIQSVGIQAMQDVLLKTLQAHFIQNDRFDPLHNAETEQQLFDNLSDIAIQVNKSSKTLVNVNFQNQLYSTSIDAKVFNAPLLQFVDELTSASTNAEHAFIQMNAAFAEQSLPGLTSAKKSLVDHDVVIDFPTLEHAKESDGSLHYITQLELKTISEKKTVTNTKNNEVAAEVVKHAVHEQKKQSLTGATHLLQAGIAVAIEHAELKMDNQQLTLDTSPNGNAKSLLESGKLIVLNDESCRDFRPNDRLGSHLADGVVTVIQVV